MISVQTLPNSPYWMIPFTVHSDASDKQLGDVMVNNNKTIALLYRELKNPQRNYTTNEKELLLIVKRLNKSRGILFGYKIIKFSDNKKLVYAATLSES